MLLVVETETAGDVEAEAVLVSLADTVAEVEAEKVRNTLVAVKAKELADWPEDVYPRN